jgi:hypothetical protein
MAHPITVILKARRMGLSWLALHFAVWIFVFHPWGPTPRIPIICKNEDDSKKLLARCERIIGRLPFWLRPTLDVRNVTSLGLGQGELLSLPATEAAGRLETATLFVLDEFAFAPNGRAQGIWTGILPTIEGGGRGIVISTGNGRQGDGAMMAKLVDDAIAGKADHSFIFLHALQRPDRNLAWMERQRRRFYTDEEFEAEYPLSVEQALHSSEEPPVYPSKGIAAAERVGRLLDEWGEEHLQDGVEIGGDWGDWQTFAVYAADLGAGSVWVTDELVLMHVEPVRASQLILSHQLRMHLDVEPIVTRTAFDAAPKGTNRTFGEVLRNDFHNPYPTEYPRTHNTVAFSIYKQGGTERRGVDTVGHIRWMLTNTADLVDAWPDDHEGQLAALARARGILAISPRASTLLHQMRELKRDPDTGKIQKPVLNPRDPKAGDHGPDGLVALLADRAKRWRMVRDQMSEEDEAA